MLKGSIVALITPFKDSSLDEDVYRQLINYHLKNGTNGIVPGGTTGESPTLSHDEHRKIIEIAVKECSGKIPVIAGTGSNSTSEAVELSKYAEKAGSDALLVVTPYYNKKNFFKNPNDIFKNFYHCNILGVRKEVKSNIELPEVKDSSFHPFRKK